MRLRLGPTLFAALLTGLTACGTTATPTDVYELPHTDTTVHPLGDAETSTDTSPSDAATTDLTAAPDVPETDAAPDAQIQDVLPADVGPQNHPPTFAPIAELMVKQGHTATVDLAPLLGDQEDGAGGLHLTWSAKHVALQDPGTHALLVVAPTAWQGTELVDLTATDSGGLTAVATLKVVVQEVVVAPPQPTENCDKHTFSVVAGKGQHTVLLSGTFNQWADKAPAADVLTDPAGTGTWSVQKQLAPGVYQYKFVVDGQWMADAQNPNQTPDGFGGKNSVVEVTPCAP